MLKTGSRKIGQAVTNKYWGTGVYITEHSVFDTGAWVGSNVMGEILMGVRQELLALEHTTEAPNDDSKNASSDSTMGDVETTSNGSEPNELKPWALVIGDSNLLDLKFDDNSLPVQVQTLAKSGTSVMDIPPLVENCELDPDNTAVVILHVGSCDWKMSDTKPTKGTSVYNHYVESLLTVSNKFPHAEIVISSVPPRSPKGKTKINAEKINDEIKILNGMLSKLPADEPNIMYIDNDASLHVTEGGAVLDAMFRDVIHLNKAGKAQLIDNLSTGIKEGYGKRGLRDEFDISAPTKL